MEDLDLEAENDSPDEPEDHPGVPVHNVLRTDVLQAHLSHKKNSTQYHAI
jgi:hypothetical protein